MNFPKGPPVLAPSRHRFSFPVFLFALMCLYGAVALDTSAAGNVIKVTEDRLISADIVDSPLTQVLRDLSQTLPIEIKGRPNGNDRLTLHFSHLTLQDALRRIMAGYNYVVIEPGPAGGRLVITILGKAARTVREETAPSSPGPATPAAANAPDEPPPAAPAQPPQIRPVPPPPPNQGQPPIAAANPVPGGDTGAPTPGAATTAAPPTPDATATPPDTQATATPPGVLPAPADQPEFNPGAWGGRGRHK